MTEYRINQRRNWKAETFPYDYFIPDFSKQCTYCLTEKQAEILRGIIEPLGWTTRWWSSSDATISRDEIQAYRDDIIRRLMMSCCGDEAPVQFRWTVDLILQRSTDGGATWEDAPEFDPRHNSTVFPPVAGDPSFSKRCIAATGMSNLIKLQVGDQLQDDTTLDELKEIIEIWVHTVIQTSNPFQAIINVAVNSILALGMSLLRAALTSTVYDTLTCIFYCRMADDLSFDDARVNLVTSDIGAQIGGIATLFLQQLINLMGAVGLTNLARSGAATEGDCSECEECLTCTQIWSIFGGAHGTDLVVTDTYVQVTASDGGNGNYYVIIKTPDADTCCSVDHIEVIGGGDVGLHGWTDCGTAQTEGVPQHTGLGWGTCVNYLQAQNATPFTIRFFLVECP